MEVIATGSRPRITAADGSVVRELAHSHWTVARGLSVAGATVSAGSETLMRRHLQSEEIYLVQAGTGRMLLAGEERAIAAGDCVAIAPGTPHRLINEGPGPLVVLCCCAPAYSEDDTQVLEQAGGSAGR